MKTLPLHTHDVYAYPETCHPDFRELGVGPGGGDGYGSGGCDPEEEPPLCSGFVHHYIAVVHGYSYGWGYGDACGAFHVPIVQEPLPIYVIS